MTREQMLMQLADQYEMMKLILEAKGNDYADEDALSNFKKGGAICGLSAEQHCLALIATKVARLGVLFNGVVAKNEAIEDSIDDLINYAFLLKCIRTDTSPKVVTNES